MNSPFRLASSALAALALFSTGSAIFAAPPSAPTAKHTSAPHKSQAESASKTAAFATIAASDKSVKSALKATDLDAAKKLDGKPGAFTGTIAKVFTPKGNGLAILNFAADYKTAATAVVRGKYFSEFPALSSLEGKQVLVTGTFKNYKDSPEIELTSPSQIKIVK